MENFNRMNVKDRTFSVKQIEGVKARDSHGISNARVFKDGNKIHAYQDSQTCLWYLKYDTGSLPEGLKDRRFTKFQYIHDFVVDYFKKRGLEATLDEEVDQNSNAA